MIRTQTRHRQKANERQKLLTGREKRRTAGWINIEDEARRETREHGKESVPPEEEPRKVRLLGWCPMKVLGRRIRGPFCV